METSFKTSKRPTAYNVFCSERLKENRHARFQSEDWGKQWRSLSEDEKKYYEDIAFTLRNKSLDVNALLKKIKNITTVLRENQEEVRKAAGIESMCTLVYKDGSLSCTGFGCLGNLLSDRRTYQKLMEFANIASSNSVKESIKELREKVALKMSKIAKSQLGLTQFPYKRAEKGDFLVTGVPPSLLPLQPPAKLATKQLQELLMSDLSVARIPRITQQTNIPSQTNTENYTETQTNAVTVTAPALEHITQQTNIPSQTNTENYTETQTNAVTVTAPALEHITQQTNIPSQTNTENYTETQTNAVTVTAPALEHITQEREQYIQNLSLETQRDSAVQHITDMQQNTAQHVDTIDVQPAENTTVNLLPSQPPRQDLADQPQPSGSVDLPKAKRIRVTWDANSMKALEDSLGPLEALTSIPSGKDLKAIRQSKPALEKFNVIQIYKKLHKIKSKKK